jgi:hypothetical protein
MDYLKLRQNLTTEPTVCSDLYVTEIDPLYSLLVVAMRRVRFDCTVAAAICMSKTPGYAGTTSEIDPLDSLSMAFAHDVLAFVACLFSLLVFSLKKRNVFSDRCGPACFICPDFANASRSTNSRKNGQSSSHSGVPAAQSGDVTQVNAVHIHPTPFPFKKRQ